MKANQLVEDKDIPARLIEIRERALDIEHRRIDTEWIPVHDMSFEWWSLWVLSGYTSWPFPGTSADQPEWLRRDFEGFNEIAEHQELYYEKVRLEERHRNNGKP